MKTRKKNIKKKRAKKKRKKKKGKMKKKKNKKIKKEKKIYTKNQIQLIYLLLLNLYLKIYFLQMNYMIIYHFWK
jgi:hypothetical protein